MKFPKTMKAVVLLASASVTVYVCTAVAGLKQDKFVTIDTVARTAEGSFGSARNSSDTNQFIYCLIDTNLTASTTMTMICRAKNNATTPIDVSCNTTDTTLIDSVQKLSTDADVKFTWDANGKCTSVTIDHSSMWPPKNP